MNELQRLIRSRMAELDVSFRDIGERGGLPWTTVSALANKTEHRQPPRAGTLEKLAKGLGVPLDVVRTAAAASAGYVLQEIPLGSKINSLEAAEDVRIVAAVMGELSAADRAKLRRLAEAFKDEIKNAGDAEQSGG